VLSRLFRRLFLERLASRLFWYQPHCVYIDREPPAGRADVLSVTGRIGA
jgi:hypothetical protein